MNIQKFAARYQNSKWMQKLIGPIWYPIKYRKLKKDYRNHATEVLLQAKACLDKAGLFFWIDFGTLLGAYREKDFIKHDLDIDISMFANDIEAAKKAMIEGGFKLYRLFTVQDDPTATEHTYTYKGLHIDIFFFKEESDFLYCHSFYWRQEDDYRFGGATEASVKKWYYPNTGFGKINFKGEIFNAPGNIEKHLSANYGETFMKPDKHFYRKNPISYNATYYSKLEKVGIYQLFE